MKKPFALLPLITILVLCFTSICVPAADIDTVREVFVRPDEETVKRWLYDREIVVVKRQLWFDRKEKIEPGKIAKLSAQGGSVFQKPPPFANYAASIWRFEYPAGKDQINHYTVVIEYEWSVKLLSVERKFVKAIITGP